MGFNFVPFKTDEKKPLEPEMKHNVEDYDSMLKEVLIIPRVTFNQIYQGSSEETTLDFKDLSLGTCSISVSKLEEDIPKHLPNLKVLSLKNISFPSDRHHPLAKYLNLSLISQLPSLEKLNVRIN